MRKLKTITRKATKARARRKDFNKKRNVRQNNWKTPRYEVEQPVMKAEKDKKGNMVYKQVDTKIVKMKGVKKLLEPGDGILPQSRKYRVSKSTTKKLLINTLGDQGANS